MTPANRPHNPSLNDLATQEELTYLAEHFNASELAEPVAAHIISSRHTIVLLINRGLAANPAEYSECLVELKGQINPIVTYR